MSRFRPAPLPTVFVAIGLVILLNLGFWQLRRNTERKGFLATIEYKLDQPPAGNEAFGDGPLEALRWRKATLAGRFLDQGPYFLTGRFEFGEPGYDLVQPFAVEGGPTLLVNRGWIPSARWRELVAETAPGPGPTTVHGLLVQPLGEADSRVLPATDDAPQRFLRDEYAAVAAHVAAGGLDVADLVMVAGLQVEAGVLKSRESYPVTGYVPKPKELPHLQYAITWFLIAGTLVTIWVAAGVRRARILAEAAR